MKTISGSLKSDLGSWGVAEAEFITISTSRRIAFLPTVQGFCWQRAFVGLMRAGEAQPDSIGIKDEDAAIFERDFLGLPAGFVAVVGVLPVEAGLIVIGGNPLFDGLPGRLDGLDLFENYDPALLRRIQRHIKFRLPDASMRR